jgi:hypothetical protein
MSCHFSYQGEKRVHTPNVDRLAREGITFTKAYATAPVVLAALHDVSFVDEKSDIESLLIVAAPFRSFEEVAP